MNVGDLLVSAARRDPSAVALVLGDQQTTYGELDALVLCVARFFRARGVTRGDRVAIWLEKGPFAIAAMQAALRLGAAYVPIDPLSPASRAASILDDCAIKLLVTSGARLDGLLAASEASRPALLVDASHARRDGVAVHCASDLPTFDATPLGVAECSDDELAYILYTSGSTGSPKGVCLSHGNAMAFIRWCVETFRATSSDVFANHAPFHFDLSVLDIYVAFAAGARVVLIPDSDAFVPGALVDTLVNQRVTVWYSVPSVLILMMQFGGRFGAKAPSVRLMLFAGEPFPVPQLRQLMGELPRAEYWNLFGPTETNVCTAFQVRSLAADATTISIGHEASFDTCWVVREDGSTAGVDEVGELIVDGPTVMLGYWGQPSTAKKPYATGDLVRRAEDGTLWYHGRRDAMLKVRGHRIEPREVEAALETHPAVERAGAYKKGEGTTAKLAAAIVLRSGARAPYLLEIKRLCAERLPRSMIVDTFTVIDAMPVTRNGKIDRKALERLPD